MQEFRTKISIPPYDFNMKHSDQILCLGSCFAENIAQKLQRNKFDSLLNPFGILYNPWSISKAINLLLKGKPYTQDQLFNNQGLWHSFDYHGAFSHPDKNEALENINTSFATAQSFLKNTNRLIITLGTANVFVYKKTSEIVANCHKIPGNEFERKRLSIKTIVEKLSSAFEQLKHQNPDLQIISTVSPIRHIRDGLIENQKSKATLLLALEKISSNLDFVNYFPAYEILLDDLRDYRFYKVDLIHPSQMAVDYIWNLFKESFFNTETKNLMLEIEKIVSASEHQPIHPNSTQHQSFLTQQLQKIVNLTEKHPFLDFSKEKMVFQSTFK